MIRESRSGITKKVSWFRSRRVSVAWTMESKQEDEDIVCLDESFFINDDYQLTTFTFGTQVIQLYCLQSASRQIVWPGAMLLNDYLCKNAEMLRGCSVIELGSGAGVTGILCSRFCRKVVLTDHNEEVLKILKKNMEFHASSENSYGYTELTAEKLEWGNSDHIHGIIQKYPEGFDLVLGADICYQQSSAPLLFDTVKQLLQIRQKGQCKFILAYVSRAKIMDALVINEANQRGMCIKEVAWTPSMASNLGVIFEITIIT